MAASRKSVRLPAGHDDGLFETLLDTAADGVMVIDEQASILVYNRACERLFGYPAKQVVGRNVSMLMPEPYRSEHDRYLQRYRKTGEKHIIGIGREVLGLRRDGSTFPMYLSVGEGRVGSKRIFVGIIHDISERAEREKHIQELQRELMHATRLTAIGQLAAALAHELNQPLTAILNYSTALADMIDWDRLEQADAMRNALGKVAEQAERAGTIIRRMRGFVEKREPKRASEDLNRTVSEAIELGLVGASYGNLKRTESFDERLPPVLVDKIQIQQVMINLLRNAVEAMRDSPVRALGVTTSHEDGFAVVSVSDTGSGLSDEVRKRLFQPFVTTKETGLGIGLSICRTIIEAHDGRLWAEAGESGGTVFRFRLPVAAPEEGSHGG